MQWNWCTSEYEDKEAKSDGFRGQFRQGSSSWDVIIYEINPDP